jgi:hypothetical protein
MIPKCKTGDCSICDLKNTNCVKVAKDLFCLGCHKKNKSKVQAEKSYSKHSNKLDTWFENRHEEMIGVCSHCGGKTEKGKSSYKCSVAHILPKAHFPSIATHPLNFVELCFYGNSCHTNFDNYYLDIEELKCFDEIVSKFTIMYPFIAESERRKIPNILLLKLKTD